MIDRAVTSNHKQPSIEIPDNLPEVDMVTDKDARDGTSETMGTTVTIMSEAVRAESGSAFVPHFFKGYSM